MAKAVRKKKETALNDEEKRRRDWELRDELISSAFFNYVLKHKKIPTYVSLAKQLQMSERTIRRHLQESEAMDDMQLKLRALRNRALLTVGIKAIKGDNVNWARLFLEMTADDKENEGNVIHINIGGKAVKQVSST